MALLLLQWPVPDRKNDGTSIQVTLIGPVATADQRNSNSLSLIDRPKPPQQFKLIGYDSNDVAAIKYGFDLK